MSLVEHHRDIRPNRRINAIREEKQPPRAVVQQFLHGYWKRYKDATDELKDSVAALQRGKGFMEIKEKVEAAAGDVDTCDEGFKD